MARTKDRASLFATITDSLTDIAQEDILQIPLTKLSPNVGQPRRYFDPEALEALAASVRERGVLQPLLVRPKDESYEIIAGERRYRAAQIAEREIVPVIVKDLTDQDAIELALVENLQREDLNPVEETEALVSLYALRNSTPRAEVAASLQRLYFAVTRGEEVESLDETERFFTELAGVSWKSFVNHRLPLLKLPEDVLQALREGKIEYTKAREIARIKDLGRRKELLLACASEGLSLKDLRNRIRTLNARTTEAQPTLLTRVGNLRGLAKKSQALEQPATRKKVEALLVRLEVLLRDGTR